MPREAVRRVTGPYGGVPPEAASDERDEEVVRDETVPPGPGGTGVVSGEDQLARLARAVVRARVEASRTTLRMRTFSGVISTHSSSRMNSSACSSES